MHIQRALAAAAIACSGCSTTDAPPTTMPSAPAESLAVQSPANIGDWMGLACDDAAENCKVQFSVAEIAMNAGCEAKPTLTKPADRLLRFTVSLDSRYNAYAEGPLPHGVDLALMIQNWTVNYGENKTLGDLQLYPECGDGVKAFTKPFQSRVYFQTTAVVGVPSDAHVLNLRYNDIGWYWVVPGPDAAGPG